MCVHALTIPQTDLPPVSSGLCQALPAAGMGSVRLVAGPKLPYHLGMSKICRLACILVSAGLWSASPLLAQTRWVPVMLAEKGLFSYDPQSVQTAERITRVRSLMDYKAPQESADGRHYLSTLNELQINCKSHEARITHTSYHSESKAGGQEIRKEGMIRDWLAIQPDTVIERIAKRVC